MPIRDRCTQDEILAAIVSRLIDQVAELNDQNCWLSDQPVPLTIPGGRFAVTVCQGAGRFPAEFFAGAGSNTLTEDGSIIVTPLVVSPIDRPRRKWRKSVGDRDKNAPSVLYFKHAILSALLGDPWEPTSLDGARFLLRDQLSPLSADAPHDVHVGETVALAMQIQFSVVFDWRL